MIDVNLPYTQPTTSPRISDFTERILLQLKPLTEGDEEIQNHVVEENEVGEQDERTQAIKLLKTGVLKSLSSEQNDYSDRFDTDLSVSAMFRFLKYPVFAFVHVNIMSRFQKPDFAAWSSKISFCFSPGVKKT